MPNLAKQTPRQRAHFTYMMDVMRRFEWDMHNRLEMSDRIPEEWHEIAKQGPAREVVRVNLGLEADVLKFFKSMGKGYGPRINLVLKSFMHARLAGVIDGAETINHFKERSLSHDGHKPQFGDIAKQVKAEWAGAPTPTDTKYQMARAWEVMRKNRADLDERGKEGLNFVRFGRMVRFV